MTSFELEQLQQNPQWLVVLQAYDERLTQLRAQNPDADGWLPRIESVEGVKPEHLAPVHGRLIAFGFLKFQLSDRHSGVSYQISPFGRRAIDRSDEADDSECDESGCAA